MQKYKLNFNKLLVTQRFRSTTRNRLRIKTNISIFYVCHSVFALRHVISNETRQNKQSFPAIANKPLPQLQTNHFHTQKKLVKSTMVNLTSFTLFIFLSQLLVKLSACYPLDVHCKISYLRLIKGQLKQMAYIVTYGDCHLKFLWKFVFHIVVQIKLDFLTFKGSCYHIFNVIH